jgi:hypothetical protein
MIACRSSLGRSAVDVRVGRVPHAISLDTAIEEELHTELQRTESGVF